MRRDTAAELSCVSVRNRRATVCGVAPLSARRAHVCARHRMASRTAHVRAPGTRERPGVPSDRRTDGCAARHAAGLVRPSATTLSAARHHTALAAARGSHNTRDSDTPRAARLSARPHVCVRSIPLVNAQTSTTSCGPTTRASNGARAPRHLRDCRQLRRCFLPCSTTIGSGASPEDQLHDHQVAMHGPFP